MIRGVVRLGRGLGVHTAKTCLLAHAKLLAHTHALAARECMICAEGQHEAEQVLKKYAELEQEMTESKVWEGVRAMGAAMQTLLGREYHACPSPAALLGTGALGLMLSFHLPWRSCFSGACGCV